MSVPKAPKLGVPKPEAVARRIALCEEELRQLKKVLRSARAAEKADLARETRRKLSIDEEAAEKAVAQAEAEQPSSYSDDDPDVHGA